MNAKRSLVLLLLVPVFVAGVWWLVRDPGSDAGPLPGSGGADRADRGAGAMMSAPGEPGEEAPAEAPEAGADAAAARQPARVAAVDADAPAVIGRVVDADGTPIAGARIVCRSRRAAIDFAELADINDPQELAERMRAGQMPAAEEETGADGAFRIPVPPGTGELGMSIEARGYLLLQRRTVRPADDDIDLGALTLRRGAVIAGRVTDSAGRPIEEARVRRVPPGQRSWFGDFEVAGMDAFDGARTSATRTRTDERGRFELAHATPGAFALRVSHADHPVGKLEEHSIEVGETLTDLLVVLESGSEITGRVIGIPEGVSNLRVLARSKKDAQSKSSGAAAFVLGNPDEIIDGVGFALGERSVDVAEDGTFELRGLNAEKTYGIWAVQGGAGFLQMSACTQRSEAPAGSRGVELRYHEGVSVTFAVVDADSGEPLSELRVAPRLVGGSGLAAMLSGAMGAQARWSDYPNGHVTLSHLRPKKKQKLSLRVEALGYAPVSREKIDLPERGSLDLGTLQLRRAPVVRVHVTDAATGAPVAGAAVRLSVVEEEGGAGKTSGRSISYSTSVNVGDGGDFEGIRMSFGGDDDKNRSGSSDADGLCVLNGFPGRDAQVTVRSADHARYLSSTISLPATGDHEHRADLVVGGSVEVLVVDSNGQPVPQATIEHKDPEKSGGSEKTDAKGVARFERLAPGTHRFKLRRKVGGSLNIQTRVNVSGSAEPPPDPGWEDVAVRNAAAAKLTLTQPATGSLAGVVRENGLPLSRARVSFVEGPGGDLDAQSEQMAEMQARLESMMGGSGGGSSARADGDGNYELADLPVGEHRLRIAHRDRAMSTMVSVNVTEGESTFDIELDATVIFGRVVDSDGKPVEGAQISVSPALVGEAREAASAIEGLFSGQNSPFGLGRSGGAKTDVDGEFELRGVRPDAPLVVRARAKGFSPASSDELRVPRGTVRRGVELKVSAAGEIEVRLIGDAPPFSAVKAEYKGEAAEGMAPVMGFLKAGRTTLQGLRPGPWEVQWSAGNNSEKKTQTVEVVAGKTAQAQFQL